MNKKNLLKAILGISLVGMVFSGYLSFVEFTGQFSGCAIYQGMLGVPVCVYGFVLFMALFILSLLAYQAGGP